MPGTPRRPCTPGTPDVPDGLISGHLLRLVRTGISLTQDQLAEQLRVDTNTLKSWETGRRPLSQTRVHTLRTILRRLHQLGADHQLLGELNTAIDVDLAVAEMLAGGSDLDGHPLATWVSTRAWSALLAWAVTGTVPPALADGSDVPRPRLAVPVREDLFAALRAAAEQHQGDAPAAVLLRRQVYYLAALDQSAAGRDWLSRMENRELRRLRRSDGWTPTWVAGRSLAVARAAQGDPEQLRHFIATQLADDRQEIANILYWSYWIGEYPVAATSDAFMAAPALNGWRGTALLRHLATGFDPAIPYVDLNVHTVWALLQRRPWLMDDDPGVTADLHARAGQLLGEDGSVGAQARRELEQLHFATATRGRP
jgi:transcriptional regulator with XRE-family HTH domain